MYDDVFYNQYGFPIPEEHTPTDEDMRQLADGQVEIVNVLATGLTRFVINELEWFLRNNSHLLCYKEDLVSESILTLHETLNNLLGRKMNPSEITAYIKECCIKAVETWAFTHRLVVSVPERTMYRKKEEFNKHTRTKLKEKHRQTSDEHLFSEVWFDDFMASLDGRDQDIMRLRIDGKSVREIAKQIGLEHHHVSKRLKSLLQKYKEG